MAELVRIPDVPICATGTYQLSSGEATFTEEDLVAAVEALRDPAVKAPRVKIDGLAASFDPGAHGGEPAFGWVDNMRVSEDGQTLLGDFMVPSWLAETIEWAYPSRSIEGCQSWRSPTGKAHDLVITAVALLGVDLPGVATLPDLSEVLADGPAATPTEVIARMPARPGRIAAGLDQDVVRRRFYEALDDGTIDVPDGVGSHWDLWVRSLRFDDHGRPYLKVQDDAAGRLYRLDFTVDGDRVAFGDWTEVVEQDVPVTAAARRPAPALAVWASREQSRAGGVATTAAASAGPDYQEESTIMDVDTTLLRRHLGLPEDATEEQIRAALETDPASQNRDVTASADTDGGESAHQPTNDERGGEPGEGAESEPREPLPVAAQAEIARLSRELAELRAREAARAERETMERRDRIVAEAIREGRIAPADRDHYRRLLDADEDTGVALLQARARGSAVPVEAAGAGGQPVDGEGGISEDVYRAYMRANHGIEVS